MNKLIIILIFLGTSILINAREVKSFNDGWSFRFNDIRTLSVGTGMLNGNGAQPVSIPHTWNINDYLTGDRDYKRCLGIYVKSFDLPEEYKGKRLFLNFEGAMMVANVFINGKFVGEHRGGYTAFTFEITKFLNFGQKNTILVGVDNSPRYDVAPLAGDFNKYGGLYRDIWLIVTEDVCISPLNYGSSGVYITTKNVTAESAELKTEVLMSGTVNYDGVEVNLRMLDRENRIVASKSTSQINNDKAVFNLKLLSPHLWDGRKDPYIYKVIITVKRGGIIADSLEEYTGFRYYSIDGDKGLFLNGNHLKIRGVCRHQDYEGVASAMTNEMHRKDYDLFEEMGLNSLRLSHYPQSHFMFSEADRRGFILWEEIPFVGGFVDSPAFKYNLETQLREMILQNYNHPSVFFWGLFNEISGNFDNLVASLNDLAHSLDPMRMTVAATDEEGPFNNITDLIGWNKYFGWYYGKYDDFMTFFDDWHKKYPDARIGVSEYGAGASILQHTEPFLLQSLPFSYTANDNAHKNPVGRWHPEEWQTEYHMNHIKYITERDYLWGSYIWNMFDFGSSVRNEGDRAGINDKGLVTYDRQTKKDAFYLYMANWNKEKPVIHLCSKRYTEPRDRNTTDIIVFTNQPGVQLFVNGIKAGKMMKPDNYSTITWKNVQLQKGENKIEVRAGSYSDSCVWSVK